MDQCVFNHCDGVHPLTRQQREHRIEVGASLNRQTLDSELECLGHRLRGYDRSLVDCVERVVEDCDARYEWRRLFQKLESLDVDLRSKIGGAGEITTWVCQ